ncbi:MAG: hypothetical protein JW800_04600 [Candidatus Omnitrophica bacterium]|nr:hypothetical protein [Candidatus Omnitrophota bacterium]
MKKDLRYRYIQKWTRQARESEDPYDVFICFWTAMTITAQIDRLKLKMHHKEEDTNREKIFDYFVKNKQEVFQVLKKNRDIMLKLIEMEGPKYKDPIIDTGDPALRNRFNELVLYYHGKIPTFSQKRMAENMAELVSRARYSIFRTTEIPDVEYDKALLQLLNPLLSDIVKVTTGY